MPTPNHTLTKPNRDIKRLSVEWSHPCVGTCEKVKVPEWTIVHKDNLARYQLSDDRIDTDIEMPDASAKRSLELSPTIQNQVQYENPMTVDFSVLDEAFLVDSTDYKPKDWSVTRSWTVPDIILTTTMILGLISIGVCIYYVHRCTRAMEDLKLGSPVGRNQFRCSENLQ